MRKFFAKGNMSLSRAIACTLAVVIIATSIPMLSWASAQKPNIENSRNIALDMGVINDGVDYTTIYKKTGQIVIEDGKSGTFKNLAYGESNTYNMSARVKINSYTQSHGSIRLRLASGEDGDAIRYVEVCIRPEKQRAILFLYKWNGTGTKEIAKKQETNITNISKEMLYTVSYANGKVSFWLGEQQIFDKVDITKGDNALSDITLETGFFADACSGTISNLQIWGDVEAIVAPQFNEHKDKNIIQDVIITNPLTKKSEKPKDSCFVSDKKDTIRCLLNGLQYGKSYNFTTTAFVEDNPDVTYEGLIFKLATASKDDIIYDIEIRVRPNARTAYMFYKKGKTEVVLGSVPNIMVSYGKANDYALEVENNKITFFKDKVALFYKVDLTQYGFNNIVYDFSIGGEVCAFKYENMRLWGDISVLNAPVFDAETETNLIQNVIVNDAFSGTTYKFNTASLKSSTKKTGRVDFLGLVLKGDYTFYANGSFSDNKDKVGEKEYNYEGIIFRIATAEKNGVNCVIELRVRNTRDILIYETLPNGTKEKLIDNIIGKNEFDTKYQYIVEFYKNGKVNFWRDGIAILYNYDLTKQGYKNIQPMMGVGGEVCNFSLDNMILVNKDVYIEPSVPAKPEGNGDYADTMQVSSNSVVKYENGTVYSTTNATTATALFEYLPFAANETYVYGFDIEVEQTDKNWKGPRIIFAKDKDGKSYALFVTANSLIVARGNKEIAKVPFVREANKKYRIDLLVEPDAVTVWLNNVLQMEKCTTPNKDKATTGIIFENAIARMSNIDLYYTTFKTYVAPVIPKKPVLKNITTNQYNAADWMSVLLAGKQYGGYFNNKLSSTDDSMAYLYTFENLPITDEMSYYYSATYNVERSTANWKGPRFIIRKMGENPIYVAVTQASILVLAGSESVASAPLKLEFGKDYNIVMYSTPTTLSVWINNECVLENIDLSKYGKLSAKMGLLFELCRAKVTSIAIYGDKVVFDPNYVDEELYNSVYYKMDGIPKMTGTNLFQNIRMIDRSGGSIGASFDAQNNIFITEYKNGVGDVSFVDAKGSNNLNGLKNESGYVFSFTHKVDGWEADSIGQSGIWFTLNSSSVPSTSTSNTIALGISGDAVMLRVLKEGKELLKETIPFSRQNGKEYNFSVVHGKNWIKLFVDNELKMVCTNLPTYNVDFACRISNAASAFHNFKLYEFEDSGLSILETAVNSDAIPAGKTIYDAQEYDFPIVKNWPVTTIVIAALITFNSAIGIGLVILGTRKKRQVAKESQEV